MPGHRSIFGIIATLVEEKETRARELLRMMSVRSRSIVGSWYLTYAGVFSVLNVLVVVASGLGAEVGLFAHSATSVLFVYFSLFSISSISYAYRATPQT